MTGGSRGIGLAIARVLAAEGYDLTITARTSEALRPAAEELRGNGVRVAEFPGNLASESVPDLMVAAHKAAFGRLDVLVNNAGVGFGAAPTEHRTKFVDLQIDVNLRAIVLLYRATVDLLSVAAREHQRAWVVNLASMAGKGGQPFLSVYGATKAGVISYTESMNAELAPLGIRSIALCPGYVDTDMSDHVKGSIPPETMIRASDVAATLPFILGLSSGCVIPEIVFARTGDLVTQL